MKTGVLTVLCGSIRSQALALVTGHSATIRKERGDKAFFRDMLFSIVSVLTPHSMGAAMFYRSRDMNGPPTDNRDDQLEINFLIRALRRPIKTNFGEAAATLANKPLLFVQERRGYSNRHR